VIPLQVGGIIMQISLESFTDITVIVSIINIIIVLYNWYLQHPKLKFYRDGKKNIYIKTTTELSYYKNSESIVFFYLKIANTSYSPITINQFSLHIKGYEPIYQRTGTHISDRYTLCKFKSKDFSDHKHYISKESILMLPCTLPPFAYCEGYAIFPYGPKFAEKNLSATLKIRTSRKTYTIRDSVSLYEVDPAEILRDNSSLLP
jgi:hypothetical protein